MDSWVQAIPYGDLTPQIPDSVFIAPGAYVIGAARLGEHVNIWYNVTVRADVHTIDIGADTNVQDEALIGIGAIVLDGAVVESNAIVAAGAVVPPGFVVPAGMMVAGVPAKVIRPVSESERTDLVGSANRYVAYARATRADLQRHFCPPGDK